jgi:hypothetical protein
MLGMKDSPLSVGPWGGYDGLSKDFVTSNIPKVYKASPSVVARCVEAASMASPTLTFDKNGQCIRVGPWGSKTKGHKHEFSMNKGNYVNFISGTHDNHGVTLLKFVSTKDVYGPFGYLIG